MRWIAFTIYLGYVEKMEDIILPIELLGDSIEVKQQK